MLPPSGPQPFMVGTLPGCVRLSVLGGHDVSKLRTRQPGLTAGASACALASLRLVALQKPATAMVAATCQKGRAGVDAANARAN